MKQFLEDRCWSLSETLYDQQSTGQIQKSECSDELKKLKVGYLHFLVSEMYLNLYFPFYSRIR